MIDLRGFLRELGRPPTGDQRHTASGREPGRAPARERWPSLAGRLDQGVDAVLLRARLGNYQRSLTSARRALGQPRPSPALNPAGTSLFTTHITTDGHDGAQRGSSAEQGDNQ
ncbi:hypothetical protein KIH74_14935 [Kineosporia sp. J2-2]|uniref:Uncharacterized protein n=1 Tax=Kineosporia corallincola TaxID=2835133 RepID=A0ABS5TIK2_9ACTN|nr:hypothetical protein [Kineosporia corallincola]MBT0770234.1 hypothetical protein [Kineosporia corallincola]